MTTNNTQLDKALNGLSSSVAVNHASSLVNYSKKRREDDESVEQAKQAILQWFAHDVIGEDTTNPQWEGDVENSLRAKQRAILKEHGWKGEK